MTKRIYVNVHEHTNTSITIEVKDENNDTVGWLALDAVPVGVSVVGANGNDSEADGQIILHAVQP